jgi:hypothetical protein
MDIKESCYYNIWESNDMGSSKVTEGWYNTSVYRERYLQKGCLGPKSPFTFDNGRSSSGWKLYMDFGRCRRWQHVLSSFVSLLKLLWSSRSQPRVVIKFSGENLNFSGGLVFHLRLSFVCLVLLKQSRRFLSNNDERPGWSFGLVF